MTEAARNAARLRRVDGYAQWLADDVDGLTANLRHDDPHATATLAEARQRVALALSHLDRAIEQDRAAHHQEHA